MGNINYKKAYEYLEEQLEDIMIETAELLDNNPATLKIDDIIVNRKQEGNVDVIISSSGENMEYALYIYKKGESVALEKLMYQHSNTFNLDLEPGRYKIKGFVRQNREQKISKDKEIRVY
ncbi:hypothetical protein [Staphylococcus canis]|uniref:Phage protein n=1 Tax=Staphylococcus canis TaxID=2724942 RepID=A0ABS0TCE1_9STAP|nr:hypothetical protein [Staphylococcus canis]MBI5975394.1 hypothetical protein [Staphylococcus canis]